MTTVGLLGLGYAVPPRIVANDDPRFAPTGDAAHHGDVSEADLFTGLERRRHIDDDALVEDLATEAARAALVDAGIAPDAIDRIYGCVSPSEFLAPSGLFRVHRDLGLGRGTQVFPVHTELTNFIACVVLAQEAILAGRCRHALVCCGAAWTRHLDFASPHARSIGDGAAAAVVGPGERFAIVDHITETWSEDFDTMVLALAPRPGEGDRVRPTFRLTDGGVRSFVTNGMTVPPRLVHELLARNGVRPDEVALVTHQASRRLMDTWADAIRPREYLSTLEEFGNVTLATVGVTLAHHARRVSASHVVLVALGLGVHFTALLLRR